MTTHPTYTQGPWDLEEIPYETNDKAGGWYLHFDPTGEHNIDALYISKAHCSEANARLIEQAPAMLVLIQSMLYMLDGGDKPSLKERDEWVEDASALLAQIEGTP